MGFLLTWYDGFVGDNAEVLGYGHLGDGNLHLNILSSKYDNNVSLLYKTGSRLFAYVIQSVSGWFTDKFFILFL
jgi:hypothetical protein